MGECVSQPTGKENKGQPTQKYNNPPHKDLYTQPTPLQNPKKVLLHDADMALLKRRLDGQPANFEGCQRDSLEKT